MRELIEKKTGGSHADEAKKLSRDLEDAKGLVWAIDKMMPGIARDKWGVEERAVKKLEKSLRDARVAISDAREAMDEIAAKLR